MEEIKEVLRKVMIKVGLRAANWPNDLEKLVLVEYVVENYGGNRLNEVSLAFDFAIKGELSEVDNNGEVKLVDANCYENFSCLYFSKIMNAYRFWSRQEIRYVSPTQKTEQRIFTQEELDNSAREDAERCYQMFLRNLDLKFPETNKNILEKDGLKPPEESVIDFYKRKALSGLTNIYVQQ